MAIAGYWAEEGRACGYQSSLYNDGTDTDM